MSKDYILHFQEEIPQIIVGQEDSTGQLQILNVIKGEDSLKVINYILGGNKCQTKKN